MWIHIEANSLKIAREEILCDMLLALGITLETNKYFPQAYNAYLSFVLSENDAIQMSVVGDSRDRIVDSVVGFSQLLDETLSIICQYESIRKYRIEIILKLLMQEGMDSAIVKQIECQDATVSQQENSDVWSTFKYEVVKCNLVGMLDL